MGIEREQVVYIAGASSRAKTAKGYIEYLSPNTKVKAFFVSAEMDDNPTDIEGIPVVSISKEEIEQFFEMYNLVHMIDEYNIYDSDFLNNEYLN